MIAGQPPPDALGARNFGLADDSAPPGAFARGAYRRLRVGPYRVLYEVEGDLITIVRIDRV
jgi:hypothetical protein